MKVFHQEVDLRSRQAMTAFLRDHPRYWTMRSWSRSTSYANCVKIHRFGLTDEQLTTAWDLLDVPVVYDTIREILNRWSAEREWRWQVGFNGRSSGYLVLCQGGLDHKNGRTARCDICGKLTWHKKDIPCTSTDCDGTLRVLPTPRPQVVTYPGRGLDQSNDFADWHVEELRDRVRLVQDFERLCDAAVAAFVAYCDNYRVVEQEITVPRTVKMLQHT